MIKNIFIAFLAASLILILTIILGIIVYVEPPQMPGIFGDQPPAWWSRGLPLSIFVYQDCPSGCIHVISPLLITIDLIFWFALSLMVIKKLIKTKSN